jgi:glutamine amidotransferase
MCELMAMSFVKPIVAKVSIQAFSGHSEQNSDGWGIAWYPDKAVAMVKQPVRWQAQQTHFLDSYPGLLSSIYVAHVRHRTTGLDPTYADTHPFARELGGREYSFAHNGTLAGAFWQRPLGRFRPVGSTDSEYLFCLLLAELDKRGAGLETMQHWKWLHQLLVGFNDHGRLNCILTDGEYLLAYHDKNGFKGLTYRHVFLHEDTAKLFGDATVEMKLQADPVNWGCIVATHPLSAEGWLRFLPGEMKVIQNGKVACCCRTGLAGAVGPGASRPEEPLAIGAAAKIAKYSGEASHENLADSARHA